MPGAFLLPGAGVARAVRAERARPRLDGGALPVPTQCPAALRSRPVKKGGKATAESDWLKLLTAPTPLRQAYLLCGWLGGPRLSEAHRLRRTRSEDQLCDGSGAWDGERRSLLAA
jgi:hypothetical protein